MHIQRIAHLVIITAYVMYLKLLKSKFFNEIFGRLF